MSVRNVQIRAIVSGLIAVASLLSNVQANPDKSDLANNEQRQCGAASPLFLSLGDAYFDIVDTSADALISQQEIAQNEVFSRLSKTHFTDGAGIRVRCTGSADQVRARMRTVSLEEIESRQRRYADVENEISITAYEYDRSSRRLTRETVTISTRPQDMIHLAAQTLETSSRHRQATRYGSYLEETRIDASIEDNAITIDQSIYVNGTLAQWHSWTLSE